MRLIYLTIDNVNDNVILAQTFPFLRRLAGLTGVEAIHLFALRKHGGQTYSAYLPSGVTEVHLADNRGMWHPFTLLGLLAFALAVVRLARRGDVLIGRNPVSLLCLQPAAWLRCARLVLDYRGILSEEYVLQGKVARGGWAHRLLRRLEGWALRRADLVLCVSERLANRARRWRPETAGKLRVVPCCYDSALAHVEASAVAQRRTELGLEPGKDFLLVYAGSLSAWNCLQDILGVYRACREVEPRTKLLVLTGDTERARHLLAEEPEVLVRSVPHEEIGSYLPLGDLGLLVRARGAVNRIASPVKFAEYLICGVPVLVSRGVGDFPQVVRREAVGFVVEDGLHAGQVLSRVRRERAALAARCRATARRIFDGNGYVDVYRELLGIPPDAGRLFVPGGRGGERRREEPL